MAARAWGYAIDHGVEVGFGGVGYENFRATTGLVISPYYDHFPTEMTDAIAASGAYIFFHTHQYMGGHAGFSGNGDQNICSINHWFCVVYAGPTGRGGDRGWYYMDFTNY